MEINMNFLDKAKRTADWIVKNQYVSHPDWDAKPYEDFDMNEDMNWTVSRQNPETGGFGTMELSVSSCVAALNCLNLHLITGDSKFLSCGYKAMANLDKYVVDRPDDRRVHGGLLGMNVCEVSENNDTLFLRVSMYSLYAFTLYHLYEQHGKTGSFADISQKLVNNPMFLGLKLRALLKIT